MAPVTIKGYVHHRHDDFGGKDEFTFFTFDATGTSMGYQLVGPAEFTYTPPEGWNATASEIAALKARRDKAAQEFAATVRAIDERLSKLQAIEFTQEAA